MNLNEFSARLAYTHTSLVTHQAADTYLGPETGGRHYHSAWKAFHLCSLFKGMCCECTRRPKFLRLAPSPALAKYVRFLTGNMKHCGCVKSSSPVFNQETFLVSDKLALLAISKQKINEWAVEEQRVASYEPVKF